ncbi:MAG: hypothetical protein PUG91_01495 [Clostridiales bacterium]|nr:hypothetical protein [Clostridiales bacterium]
MKKRIMALIVAAIMLLTAVPSLADVDKKEMVYVLANASGEATDIVVSERLYNRDSLDTLEDVSRLSGIENLSGDQTFTQDGDKIVWNANGSEIRYEGHSTEELPFSVAFHYTLDGVEMTPAELAGKSGHLEMTIDYTSNLTGEAEINGQTETLPIPFLMATVMLAEDDVFSNLQVTNGRVLEVGDRTLVLCYGLPGLAEALKSGVTSDEVDINFDDIPSSAVVSADVTDFSFGGTYTLVASSSVADEETEDGELSLSFDFDEISSELTDAMSQLMDGSSDLYDGLKELLDGTQDLCDGLSEIDANSAALTDGARQVLDTVLETANETLAESEGDFAKLGITLNTLTIDNYASEIDRLQTEMLNNLEDYVIEQADKKLASKVDEAVKAEVVKQVNAAAREQVTEKVTEAVKAQVRDQVNAAVRAKVEAAVRNPDDATLSATVDAQMNSDDVKAQINQNIDAQMASDDVKALIEQKIDETLKSDDVQAQIDAKVASDYEQAIRDGVQQAWNGAYEQIKAGYYDTIKAQVTEAVRAQAAETLKSSVPEDGSVTLDQLVDAYMAKDETQQAIEAEVNNQITALTNQNVNTEQLIADKLAETRAQVEAYVRENTIRPQVEAAVKDEVTKQVTAAARQKVVDAIRGMSDEQVNAIVDQKMADPEITAQAEAAFNEQMASDSVKAIINQNVDEQMKTDDVKALINKNIDEQMKSSKVKNIISEQMTVNRKSKEYLDGVAEALEENGKNGAAYQALVKLRQTMDDIHTFYQGVVDYTDAVGQAKDGALKLNDGASQLYDGMGELKDGLTEFNEKAIDKLLAFIDEDLPSLKDHAQAVIDMARGYTSYAGIAEGQTGSVQFIVRTEGV